MVFGNSNQSNVRRELHDGTGVQELVDSCAAHLKVRFLIRRLYLLVLLTLAS